MNSNIEKIKAKERSFVMKLTKKDIETLLYKCGRTLNKNVADDSGKPLPAVERFYNEDKNEFQIMLRVENINTASEELYNALTIHMPFIKSSGYNPKNSVIILSDFSLSELSLGFDDNVSQNQQLIYARFMYDKFGEYYREKYNQHVRKEIKNEKQDQVKWLLKMEGNTLPFLTQ